MRVSVYFNLHNKLWSVRDNKTGRVIGHAARVLLRDATFRVQKAGQRRVRETGVKNVHAFVVGELEAADWVWLSKEFNPWSDFTPFGWELTAKANDAYLAASRKYGKRVMYNPYRFDSFVFEENGHQTRVDAAPMVSLHATTRGVYAFDPCNMTQEESERATA